MGPALASLSDILKQMYPQKTIAQHMNKNIRIVGVRQPDQIEISTMYCGLGKRFISQEGWCYAETLTPGDMLNTQNGKFCTVLAKDDVNVTILFADGRIELEPVYKLVLVHRLQKADTA